MHGSPCCGCVRRVVVIVVEKMCLFSGEKNKNRLGGACIDLCPLRDDVWDLCQFCSRDVRNARTEEEEVCSDVIASPDWSLFCYCC